MSCSTSSWPALRLRPARLSRPPRLAGPPLVLGHEMVGRIDGRRYTVYPLIGCGHCDRCRRARRTYARSDRLIGMHRRACFGEQIEVPRSALVELPEGVDPRRAVLTEPLACAVARTRAIFVARRHARGGYRLRIDRAAGHRCRAAARSEVVAIDPIAERRPGPSGWRRRALWLMRLQCRMLILSWTRRASRRRGGRRWV
jgi:Alcohol dehydrogenase GroES-like domain